MNSKEKYIKSANIILMLFIFFLLFFIPIIFVRDQNGFNWNSILKIWQDRILLIPLFAINHWILIPRLILKKRYKQYLLLAFALIISLTTTYFYIEKSNLQNRRGGAPPPPQRERIEATNNRPANPPKERPNNRPARRPDYRNVDTSNRPQERRASARPLTPIPPYADLLLFSLLIVAVDSGLSFIKHWHEIEDDKTLLEKKNIQAQLGILRNQLSPHFFMNTLNNIYSLVEADKKRSREAIMKLSKLMRYLLYENKDGKVLLSKELDFIKSYIDLMKLRFAEGVDIKLQIPEVYDDIEIPVLLFISYIENAFKYGASYENKSKIDVAFDISQNHLYFFCLNTINVFSTQRKGGIGLVNSKQRLDLLYKDQYDLKIDENENVYTVKLKIPLS